MRRFKELTLNEANRQAPLQELYSRLEEDLDTVDSGRDIVDRQRALDRVVIDGHGRDDGNGKPFIHLRLRVSDPEILRLFDQAGIDYNKARGEKCYSVRVSHLRVRA